MSEKKAPFKLIILIILVIFIGIVWAAQTAGVINLKKAASNVPVLKNYFQQPIVAQTNIPQESPIETENKTLQDKNKELENKILALENEKTQFLAKDAQTQKDLTDLQNYKAQKAKEALTTKQMAAYYNGMKADAVVKIMDNLDDDTVVSIIPLLDKEQAGKILSLMNPQRAALLTQMLMGKQ